MMKKNIIILLLIMGNNLFAQQIDFNYTYIDEFQMIVEDDKVITILDSNLKLISYINPDAEEYFIPSDTSYREYFISKNIYMIDSLVYANYRNLVMRVNVVGIYKTQIKKNKFIIVYCYDGQLIGSFQQPTYFIFKEEKGSYKLQSVYQIENVDGYATGVMESMQMFYNNNRIQMKGINLNLLWDSGIRKYSRTIPLQKITFHGVPVKITFDSLQFLFGLPEINYQIYYDSPEKGYQTDSAEILIYQKCGLRYIKKGDTVNLCGICFQKNPNASVMFNDILINGSTTLNEFEENFNISKEYVSTHYFHNIACDCELYTGFAYVIRLFDKKVFSEWHFDERNRLVSAKFY